MPAVCGCVDGTHVKIKKPAEFEEQFVNRHGDHSLNCMCVAGPDFRFYYASANWPGAIHDAQVLRNRVLCCPHCLEKT